MHEFGSESPREVGEPFSIKIRVTGGCFHREHSPQAYEIIDEYLSSLHKSDYYFRFEEHESGPELLVYLALTTAGITLATSLINMIITIIKARSEGIKKGDNPRQALEIIVRKVRRNNEYVEEKIMRIENTDLISKVKLKKAIEKSAIKQLKEKDSGKNR